MEEKKHDEEKEREKDNIDEEIYHDEIFFGVSVVYLSVEDSCLHLRPFFLSFDEILP